MLDKHLDEGSTHGDHMLAAAFGARFIFLKYRKEEKKESSRGTRKHKRNSRNVKRRKLEKLKLKIPSIVNFSVSRLRLLLFFTFVSSFTCLHGFRCRLSMSWFAMGQRYESTSANRHENSHPHVMLSSATNIFDKKRM